MANPQSPRIALGQMNAALGDFRSNARKILDLARRANSRNAALLALPLGALTGVPIGDLALSRSFTARTRRAQAELATALASAGLGNLPVITGSEGLRGSAGTSSAESPPQLFALQNGSVAELSLSAGVASCEVGGMSVAVLPWLQPNQLPPAPATHDLLLVLAALPYTDSGPATIQELLSAAARGTGAATAYVNLVGGQDDLVFAGGSALLHTDGALLERAPLFAEHLCLPRIGAAGDVSPDLDSPAELYRALTLGIADYVAKNGFQTVTLGLSGGIDSALVAVIAADALGGAKVHGIGMPSPHSSQHSRADASDLARRIGANYEEIGIGAMMDSFTAAMEMPGVTGENLQARIRGILLMAAANRDGHLVLAPGNKSELAVGYSTIYGDAVGGYGPIKDLYKTQVWELARWRNDQALDRGAIPPIPESSITKPPSAELRPDQTDQDALPNYEILDAILRAHLEASAGRAELIAAGFDSEIVDWTLRAVQISEWKRRQYPVGPKVSARSFDVDRRVPITNRWRDSEEFDG